MQIALENIQIASPCSESWDAMKGDDRTRHCDKCALNVYNLSGMSREEAVGLVNRSEGRVCLRFYRRRDGTVLTADCPVGMRAVGRRMVIVGAVFAVSLIGAASFGAVQTARRASPGESLGSAIANLWYTVLEELPPWVVPASWRPARLTPTVGDMCVFPVVTPPVVK